jgi:predicted alpha/beta-fold hydrolase
VRSTHFLHPVFTEMQSPKIQQGKYLSNRSLRALQNSLSLISEVLAFQVLELWVKDSHEESCKYVFVTQEAAALYPQIKTGYLPDREQKVIISLKVRFSL